MANRNFNKQTTNARQGNTKDLNKAISEAYRVLRRVFKKK